MTSAIPMLVEPDPRLRRLIARKGLDRTLPDAGIGPEDVFEAWQDGYASAEDAIERIRKLVLAGHDEGGWRARVEAGDQTR